MSLDLNLNSRPYFDDYNANNNFYRVLYRPTTALQARELTQQQSIFQNQLESFGKHIFKDGSIVEGVTLTFDGEYNYVKVEDVYANGGSLTITDIENKVVQNANGLKATVVNTVDGYQSQSPNLKTLYVKYINQTTYSNGQSQVVFDPTDNLTVYANSSSSNSLGIVVVANTTVDANSVGSGYATYASDGIIFQKGFFIRTDPQTVIVEKYSNVPNNVSIGFKTTETIVTSDTDESLLDNAQGSSNYAAPGAHRLKLTPTLVVRQTDAISNTDNFFSLADFVDGEVLTVKHDPQYAALGAELARRTHEESGNYVIDPFNIRSMSISGNTTHLNLQVDPGLAYIEGYRVHQLAQVTTPIRKGNDVAEAEAQIITANYGNYVEVNEVAGVFDFENLDTVDLYDTAQDAVTSNTSVGTAVNSITPAGNKIGEANIRGFAYQSGTPGTPTAVYRMYLFNIVMNEGRSFKDVRAFAASDGGSNEGYADAILTNNEAVLVDSGLNKLVFPFGQKSIKTLRDLDNNNDTQYVVRISQDVTFQTNGSATFSPPAAHAGGDETLNIIGSPISETSEQSFIVIPTATGYTANLTGNVAVAATVNVTGTGTSFSTDYVVGDYIRVNHGSPQTRRITSIANDTWMNVSSAFTISNTSTTHNIAFVAGAPVAMNNRTARTITTTSNSAIVNIANTSVGLTGAIAAKVYYDIKRDNAVQTSKIVNKNRFVKLDLANNAAGTTGPWCLGIPDAYKLRGVYIGYTANSYSNTNTDYKADFELDTGQRNGLYSLSYLKLKQGSTTTVNSSAQILVEVDHFTHDRTAGIGFFSVDSYPIDDANTANTSAITTQEIPIYTSPSDGQSISLRDAIDFRPIVTNTAVSATSNTTATTNPATTITFNVDSDGAYTPTPDSNFQADLQYYLGRIDKVFMSPSGRLEVIEGTPSVFPRTPTDKSGLMSLASVVIPPFPSLSAADARTYQRTDYGITLNYLQNRRYTMRDIGVLAGRIKTLEYYTSLSILEKAAKDLIISDTDGNNRFKNGFLVDPFRGHDIGDTKDPGYKIAVDQSRSEIRPLFEQNFVPLQFDSTNSNNVSLTGDLATIDFTEQTFIQQPFASKQRDAVEMTLFLWSGNIFLDPEGDYHADTTINPDVVANIDLAQNWINLAEAWGTQWGTWNTSSISSSANTLTNTRTTGTSETGTTTTTTSTTTTTTTEQQVRIGTQLDVDVQSVDYNFGSYVTDVSIQPFIRPQIIKFHAIGLRPNAKVYAHFDDTAVSTYCTPTSSAYIPSAAEGTQLQTDSNGQVYGLFRIPASTFRTGERTFKIVDVADLTTERNVIRSIASAKFQGSAIAIEKNNISLQTRQAQIAQQSVLEQRTLTNVDVDTNVNIVTVPPEPQVIETPAEEAQRPPPATPTTNNPPVGRNGGAGGGDPISQTFFVRTPNKNTAGAYISKLDLYFGSKPSDLGYGVEVQIREVINGFPGPSIMPFGRVHKAHDDINVSSTAETATTFTFSSPIFLRSNKEYCFVVRPTGNVGGYTLWIGEQGGTDVITSAPIYDNNFVGVMFLSSNDRTWTPYQREDIKFTLYRCQFDSNATQTSTARYTNEDYEFFTVNNYIGTFQVGEYVYQTNGALESSGVTISSSSANVTVANANVIANGDMIYIASNTGATYQLATANVANSTTLVLNVTPTFTDANGSFGKISGNGSLYSVCTFVDGNKLKIHTTNSTSNTTVQYEANNSYVLVGNTSGAHANIVSIDDISYNALAIKFSSIAPSGTSLQWKFKGYSNSAVVDSSFINLGTDRENQFTDKSRVIMSKSNEGTTISGSKSLVIQGNMMTQSKYLSPAIDNIETGVIAIRNIISANTTGEDGNNGSANTRYISKKVTLADGQDAEDIIAYLTSYKPSGTDVKVYGRFLNSEDPENFDQKAWTLLTQTTGSATVSSSVNIDDYREFEYKLPNSALVVSGAANTWSNTLVNTHVYTGQFTANQYIYIRDNTSTAETFNIRKVNSVDTSAGQITVDSNVSFTSANIEIGTISALANNEGTFLYTPNSTYSVARYVDGDGIVYDSYKVFAIKIVLTADSPALVPRVQDMRAIALQQ